jgi:ABC-type uncharacterized transport system ATPase component
MGVNDLPYYADRPLLADLCPTRSAQDDPLLPFEPSDVRGPVLDPSGRSLRPLLTDSKLAGLSILSDATACKLTPEIWHTRFLARLRDADFLINDNIKAVTMKISYSSDHLSITRFDEIDAPDFVVLTGVNGAGKSHLLDAISQKQVLIDNNNGQRTVKFNFESFKLDNESAYSAHQISNERDAAWQILETQVKPNIIGHKNSLSDEYKALLDQAESLSSPLWSLTGSPQFGAYKQHIQNIFSTHHQLRGNQQAVAILALAKRLPYSIDEITREEFNRMYKPFETRQDFLPAALGKVIWDYYIKYRSNQVNEFENERHGKNYPVMTEAQFIAVHGEKPWEIINSILSDFESLEYKINSPEGVDIFSNYQLRLTHKLKPDVQLDFSSLSSGERVLMALVASIYKSSSDNQFPDVILLDELDASLHPSMIRNMLSVIRDIFLARGVKVILVTHSPTTIALAPDESVYLMNKEGVQRIQKTSKENALSILTEGFATLSDGMMIFDEVTRSPISILTEGFNTEFIKKALHFHGIGGVRLIGGVEAITGKSQLKTLFDFFSRIEHKNIVIFIWDCDAKYSLKETNKTVPIIIEENPSNSIAKGGIENAFPIELFEDFKKTITMSNGTAKIEFDETRKRDFEQFVLTRNSPDDFAWFGTICKKIKAIQETGTSTDSPTAQTSV